MRVLSSLVIVALASFALNANAWFNADEDIFDRIERALTSYPKATRQVNSACQLILTSGQTPPPVDELTARSRAFRALHLEGDRAVTPGFGRDFDVDHASSKRSKRRLARRLRGIEVWGENEVRTANVRQAGMVYRGREEIEAYLNRANDVREKLRGILGEESHVERMKDLSEHKITALVVAAAGVGTLLFTKGLVGADYLTLIGLVALVDPFTVVRNRNQDGGTKDFEARAREYLNRPTEVQAERWIAASRTYRTTSPVLDAIATRDFEATRSALQRQEFSEGLPLWRPVAFATFFGLAEIFDATSPRWDVFRRGYVMTDHVLTLNRETGQPELFVGVRSTLERPGRVRVRPFTAAD